MKKLCTMMIAVLLCLCMAVPAMAFQGSASLKLDGLSSRYWIYDTDVLRVSGSEGYAMCTVDGTLLTEAKYNSFEGINGYVKAVRTDISSVNCYGVMDTQGNTVVPFQYGDLRIESAEWALGIVLATASASQYDYKNYDGDQFWNIERVDVYYLGEAKMVASLTRDQFLDADVVNHCLNIQDRTTSVISCYDSNFTQVGTNLKSLYDDSYAPGDYTYYRENGQYGIKDAAGNIVMQPSYQYLETPGRRGYIVVSTGEKEGLVSLSDGSLCIPAEYDDILSSYYLPTDETGTGSGYVAFGYVGVLLNNKLCYVNINGEITCQTNYAKGIADNYGVSAMLTDLEGKIHIIAADGVETVLEGYERVSVMDSTAGMYYRVTDANGKYGLVDWHGNIVLPCQYSRITISESGKYALVDVDYSTCQMYELTYPEVTTAAETQASNEGGFGSLLNSLMQNSSQTAEAPADQNASEAAASDANASGVATLVNSAVTLLQMDPVANKDSVISLLNNALQMAGDDAATASLLNSAITLLNVDAAQNAASVIVLLQSK